MINIEEKTITEKWIKKTDSYEVTIECLVYNHGQFLEKALDSFLSQKTNFPFKIFVHDDCSTDNTAEIIKLYAKKFPNLIFPCFEKENLWSKHDGSLFKKVIQHCDTKYISICEGDDFWTDNNKLQKQYDYMEKNKNCSICISNGYIYDVDKNRKKSVLPFREKIFGRKNRVITLNNCHRILFPPTASYFYRKSEIQGIENVPKSNLGDSRLRLFLLTKGFCFYFSDKMVTYRKGVHNSATTNWHNLTNFRVAQMSENNILMNEYIRSLSKDNKNYGLDKLNSLHSYNILIHLENPTLKCIKKSKWYSYLFLSEKFKIFIKSLRGDFRNEKN